ncbi:MAG: hypothetical protein J6E43_03720 [Prevotella sp.]|nr:hypothetical protein [Prevotella sp.]
MTRLLTILICCLSLNAHAQSEPQTEAADSLVYEEYVTAFSRAFFDNDAFERALTTYQEADTASMTDYDLLKYAMAAYFKHEYQQTLDIISIRLESKPCDIGFVRLAFFCAVDLKNYDDAEQYADMLFDMSPTDQLYYYDYAYFIRYINAKTDPSPADTQRLILSYEQLISHYLTLDRSTAGRLQGKNGKTTAQTYARKLLEIDPQNQKAKQALQP